MSDIVLSAATGRPTLADVLPNSLAAMAGAPNALGLPPVRHAVILLVDGLGALQLRSRSGHARRLVEGWPKRDTAFSFPSTTTSGITTLATGVRAGEHGMLAYTVYDRAAGELRNQLSGWGPGMDPRVWQPVPTLFERAGELCPGAEPVVVGLPQYADSGLTHAALRGAEYLAADSIEERMRRTLDVLAERDRALVYCYVAELDQAGHAFGWGSDAWLAALEELDRAAGVLRAELPADAGLLITADHGMLDIPESRHLEIDEAGPLLDGVVAVAGEPRLRHLVLEDASRADELAERWRAAEGSRAAILTRDEAIAAGWYGPVVTDTARERIGDVVVAAQKEIVYFTAAMQGPVRRLVGHHGSISAEETIVPLIRHGAFAR